MPERPLLYYITDRTAFAADEPTRRRRLLEKISEAARAGVDYIQLREKDLPSRELELLAIEVVAMLRRVKSEDSRVRTALLINSRTDIALAAAADGVHLRSEDISPHDVKAIWNKCGAGTPARISPEQPVIGVSCHSPEEVSAADANGAMFAVFAPVFEKKDAPEVVPKSLSLLREACKSKIPVLALGGVTLANAGSCLEAGAAGIAGIRLFQENDIEKIVQELQRL
jgi:thiamine-phosphate pyrophosphorylase